MALFGGQPIPAQGFSVVLQNAEVILKRVLNPKKDGHVFYGAGVVNEPEIELRHAVPLLGSQPDQAFGFGGVLRDAFTSGVHEPERELRPGVSLLDAKPEPAYGFGVILLDVFADGRLERERELHTPSPARLFQALLAGAAEI